jgi:hypothetical protein
MEKRIQILDSVNAKHVNADGVLDHDAAWQELLQQEMPDITEFFRHTVTLRMDGHYGDYDKLTSGQSPDVNPPDSVIATFANLSKTIQVTNGECNYK